MIVRSLAFSNDSNYLVSVSDDSYVKVYDLREKKDTETDRRFNTINFSGHCSWVLNATFAPDNNHFATGFVNYHFYLFDKLINNTLFVIVVQQIKP